MGLDMYLFNVSKAPFLKEGETYSRKELSKLSNIITLDVNEDICETIRKNATKIKCVERVYSPKLIGKLIGNNNIEYIHRAIECGGKDHYIIFKLYDKNNNDIGEIRIDSSNEEKVLEEKEFDYLAIKMTEIDYQRKGLNEYGWSLLPENTEYSDDYDNIKKMCQEGGLSCSFLDNWEEDKTVFMAWW